MTSKRISLLFLFGSVLILILGLSFGVIGGLQYIIPELFKECLPFMKTRPLHVTLVITWIISGAVGGIYYYFPNATGVNWYSPKFCLLHFFILMLTTVSIIISYLLGKFGGREYMEYPPVLAIGILVTWIIFTINFLFTIKRMIGKWPVYIWMWTTGILFFLLTYLESYLWLLPYFRDNIIRDVTVQWKSLGSMVGSWNMLIYGTAFYLMEVISDDKHLARSKKVFFFYFLGLTNLMFNWGHHTYIVPAAPYIKNISYIISMTELLILGNIIWNWRKTVNVAVKNFYFFPYRFLLASDVWIFLNLILAIFISIPAINYYTHGTHITVAHAMGTTIGINSMILFGSVFYILTKEDESFINSHKKLIAFGFWVFNIFLIIFWIALLYAGYIKSIMMVPGITNNFIEVMKKLEPIFRFFTIAGIVVYGEMIILSYVACRRFFLIFFNRNK
jgi:nitric oxide reductase subunit B